jgi:hypothetical protein
MIVPYDVFLSPSSPRYFGNTEYYRHFYALVRSNPSLFEGYSTMAVYNTVGTDFVVGGLVTLRDTSTTNIGNTTAVLRRDGGSGRVLHLANWGGGGRSYVVDIAKSAFSTSPGGATLFRPGSAPVPATLQSVGSVWRVTVSGVDRWGVVAFGQAAAPPVLDVPADRMGIIFEPTFYKLTNPDLPGMTDAQALSHWQLNGAREGRISAPSFNVRFYLATYPDLRDAFGADNYVEAARHFAFSGVIEGRLGSEVFSSHFYLARYPDLQAAFGVSNFAQATKHYAAQGIVEGRTARDSFDPVVYLRRYPDLAATFGTNYRAAVVHYILQGQFEGRSGPP